MFKTDLITKRDMTKNNCWILTEDLIYEDDKYIITVKAGFDFDYASVPWLFRLFLPKNGVEYDRASCIHDALYASHYLPRDICDGILKEASLADKVSIITANLMYNAVRLGGSFAYKDITAKELVEYRKLVTVAIKGTK